MLCSYRTSLERKGPTLQVCACMRACVHVFVLVYDYMYMYMSLVFVVYLSDMTNLTVTMDTMLDCVRNNEQTWQQLLTRQKHHCNPVTAELSNGTTQSTECVTSQMVGHVTCDAPQTRVFSNLSDVVAWCTGDHSDSSHPPPPKLSEAERVQVLVTGSLHLAGAFMSVLDVRVDES